jgi:GNAT superfamily N-acetyltransferase
MTATDPNAAEVEKKPFDIDRLVLRKHRVSELDDLARMNKELLEDEKHRSSLTVAELKERFRRFVDEDGWSVEVFTCDEDIVGYITYRVEPDETTPNGRSVFLRQFYISRSHRRLGLGAATMALFKSSRLKHGERIFLEVLESNPRGRAFWQSVGFTPYSTIMEHSV